VRDGQEVADNTFTADVSAFPIASTVLGAAAPTQGPSLANRSRSVRTDYLPDEQISTATSADFQKSEIQSGHDALNLLVKAAASRTRSRSSSNALDETLRDRKSSAMAYYDLTQMMERNVLASFSRINDQVNSPPPAQDNPSPSRNNPSALSSSPVFLLDTLFIPYRPSSSICPPLSDTMTALAAWSHFKFVRDGWFNAREAIAFVQYFYDELSPLTPVVMPDYSSPASHERLLSNEPVLAVTILTIASRHMHLTGIAGTAISATARPQAIHQKLWEYLEGVIQRLIWGKEKFLGFAEPIPGSEFPLSVSENPDFNPYKRKGLRTLGTVESLMLLTEWHPRSMHFPGPENDNELLTFEPLAAPARDQHSAEHFARSFRGQSPHDWLEPCLRSDRVCWMLLSLATTLAYEVGVFEEDMDAFRAEVPETTWLVYDTRRMHVKNLILIYNTQTAGRTGLAPNLPEHYGEPTTSSHFEPSWLSYSSPKDFVIHLFLRAAKIMRQGNKLLFRKREHTRQIIRNGEYKQLLDDLNPSMEQWRNAFDTSPAIPALMRHILVIEFEYARVFINSLALQAVFERCINNSPRQGNAQSANDMIDNEPTPISPEEFQKWYGEDRVYVRRVVDGCRNVMRAVTEGLYPGGHLRNAPVRTYFRIISVSVILLKTFALGVAEDEAMMSLDMLDLTVHAMRTCIVDEIHVAGRFADMIGVLSKRIRARLIRISRNATAPATARAASETTFDQSYTSMPSQQQSNVRNSSRANPKRSTSNRTGGQSNRSRRQSNRSDVTPMQGVTQSSPFASSDHDFTMGMGPGISNAGQINNWVGLPLNNFMNSGGDVTQTVYGPEVNDNRMFPMLLNHEQSSSGDQSHGGPHA